jgi:hypothetical protein
MTENHPTPIVRTRDGYLIHGVDTVEFAEIVGLTPTPAFILDIDYQTATADERARLAELAKRLGGSA